MLKLNKTGFTLIEILAVIVILGIISALIVPVAIGIIEDTKQEAYDIQVDNIKDAAKGYIAEYGTSITELNLVGGTYELTLRDLVDDGVIDEPIKNPTTGENMDLDLTTILVTKTTTGYTYSVTVN